ncbi:MAG TPA: M20/M25/M40 family metallo-hydrolase [Candidatus Limnocylindria bacterium]|nr:M20/M25/M40 family metallo-hydrolase [Candidatus Limnocylindria bacterium]
MASVMEDTTDLLQHLIRNACVNDGTPASGNEIRTVDTLASYLQAPGVEMKRYEPSPGRGSLVLRIEGSDPKAPSLHLMGHTDVVPVTRSGWRHDPFGGELIDGEVWGRGAIDMLDVTASMAVAIKRLLTDGFRPKGTLIYSAVADEEALGTWGAQWLTENAWDDVKSDYLVTEFGGARIPIGRGAKLPIMTAEKGSQWTRLRVKGTPGHGSMPYRSDNALVKASELITRIARYKAPLHLGDLWKEFIEGMDLPAVQRIAVLTAATFDAALDRMPEGTDRMMYAATRTTLSPNIAQSGVKLNVIPDTAEVQIDIRTLPGDDGEGVHAMLRDAAGDLWSDVEIVDEGHNPATSSPRDTPLWHALTKVTQRLVPDSTTVPFLIVGATDSRFFRRKGVVSYGYGLMSERIPFGEFAKLFHGNNERIDQDTLALMTPLWDGVVREMLA